jgi:hypothetical protein
MSTDTEPVISIKEEIKVTSKYVTWIISNKKYIFIGFSIIILIIFCVWLWKRYNKNKDESKVETKVEHMSHKKKDNSLKLNKEHDFKEGLRIMDKSISGMMQSNKDIIKLKETILELKNSSNEESFIERKELQKNIDSIIKFSNKLNNKIKQIKSLVIEDAKACNKYSKSLQESLDETIEKSNDIYKSSLAEIDDLNEQIKLEPIVEDNETNEETE